MSDDNFSADDQDLVLRLRAGHPEALEIVMERYQTVLAYYAEGIVHSPDLADDVLQNVFVRLWELRHTLEVHGSLRGYLFGAVRNIALNLLHSEQARVHREHSVAGEISHEAEIDLAEAEETQIAIRNAVAELPPRCRDVFILVREHGFSYPEVATVLGISLSTVKTQMGRAMVYLAKRLAPFFVLMIVVSETTAPLRVGVIPGSF